MGGRVAGKRAFVTGAGQGMGRAVAIALAEDGARVVAASRTGAKLAALVPFGIETAPLDVTDGAAVAREIAAAGPFDILVNCAGWVHAGGLLETTDEDWRASLEQNVTSMFFTIRAALPAMLERRAGAIVNVASVASSITGVAGRAAYGASKAAVIGLTKAVAREGIAHGVRCNALAPGTTHSPSLVERAEATGDREAAMAAFTARQPMGRLGTVEAMAASVLYLASDEGAFMTGQILVVDGGQTL
ncbi:SDR family oxidoreductase [Elioraea rosea]|uniref:SDR family oxidoreductase n=1 Tax=Elioraea rosea TaxID=2492390 RepID=UPI001184E7E0|nr:SDR family oxidoreductase [Elioraea rosea]